MFADDAMQRASKNLVIHRAEQIANHEHVANRIRQLECELRASCIECSHFAADLTRKQQELEDLRRDRSRANSDVGVIAVRLAAINDHKNQLQGKVKIMRDGTEAALTSFACFPSDVAQTIRAARERRETRDTATLYLRTFERLTAEIERARVMDLLVSLVNESTSLDPSSKRNVVGQRSALTDAALAVTLAQSRLREATLAATQSKCAALNEETAATWLRVAQSKDLALALESSATCLKFSMNDHGVRIAQVSSRNAVTADESQIHCVAVAAWRSAVQDLRLQIDAATKNGDEQRRLAEAQLQSVHCKRDEIVASIANSAGDLANMKRRCATAVSVLQQAVTLARDFSSGVTRHQEQMRCAHARRLILQGSRDVMQQFAEHRRSVMSDERLGRALVEMCQADEYGTMMSWSWHVITAIIPLVVREQEKRVSLVESWSLSRKGLDVSFGQQATQLAVAQRAAERAAAERAAAERVAADRAAAERVAADRAAAERAAAERVAAERVAADRAAAARIALAAAQACAVDERTTDMSDSGSTKRRSFGKRETSTVRSGKKQPPQARTQPSTTSSARRRIMTQQSASSQDSGEWTVGEAARRIVQRTNTDVPTNVPRTPISRPAILDTTSQRAGGSALNRAITVGGASLSAARPGANRKLFAEDFESPPPRAPVSAVKSASAAVRVRPSGTIQRSLKLPATTPRPKANHTDEEVMFDIFTM